MLSSLFNAKKSPSQAKTERNMELIKLHNDGASFRELGLKYGISSARAAELYSLYSSRLDKNPEQEYTGIIGSGSDGNE